MNFAYIKDFERFTKDDCQKLMESFGDKSSQRLDKAFKKIGRVQLSNGSYFETKDIVKYVNDAIEMIRWDWGSFFDFVSNFTIIYIINDPEIKTMAVDGHFNMYIDALFVYNLMHTYEGSENDTKKEKDETYKKNLMIVGAIIMHEIFHVVFNHIERGERWCLSKNKTLDRRAQHDNNLAADIEVNTALMKKNILNLDIIEHIGALYLKELSANVPPMEEILENEKLMNKLRSMHPFKENTGGGGNGGENNNENEVKETTEEFDEGYVEMMNKIAELVNKYGPEETIKKLREVGAVAPNATPKLGVDFSTDDILSMNFFHIKSFDTFIKESKEESENDDNPFSTREQGRIAAVQKAIDEINAAMFGGEEGGDGGGQQGPVPKTNIDKDRLTPMNLPGKKKSSKGGETDGGLPTNINQEQDENEKEGKKETEGYGTPTDEKDDGGKNDDGEKGKGKGKTGSGSNGKIADGKGQQSDINITYRDKPKGGSKGSNSIESSSVGKTGTFIGKGDDGKFNDVIERTYGKEYASEVKEIVKKNKAINTRETVEKKKKDFYNKVASGALKDIWDNAKKSERKYMAMWKKILKRFLDLKSRRAGRKKLSDTIRWGERRHMAIGQMSPFIPKKAQEQQDINVYIDVSGSVWSNMKLMKLMAESLVSFLKTFKYSGINIVAWATKTGEIHKVESLSKSNEGAAVKEITDYIEEMGGTLGGGTDIECCIKGIENITFQDKNRKKRDDAHVIITDGYIDYNKLPNLEEDIINTITEHDGGDKTIGNTVAKNCIWIVYDNDNSSWDENIKLGEMVKIYSNNIIPC